jgi:hypothetical protein
MIVMIIEKEKINNLAREKYITLSIVIQHLFLHRDNKTG